MCAVNRKTLFTLVVALAFSSLAAVGQVRRVGLALPSLALSVNSLTFNPQAIGTISAAQEILLQNHTDTPLALTGIVAVGDYQQTNTCWSGVQPGGFCIIKVSFLPTAAGIRGGAVLIPSTPVEYVALSGTGSGASVMLSANSLHFPDQGVGTVSAPLVATLINSGTSPLKIASVITLGQFRQSNDCGPSIKPNDTCSIHVTFRPSAPGEQDGAVLISDNTSGGTETVLLRAHASAPIVSLSSKRLSFGAVDISGSSPVQSVTLSNAGNAPLQISSIATSGDFTQVNDCVSPAPAGSSCTIHIRLVPKAAGRRDGLLTVKSNGLGPNRVALTGTGADFSMSTDQTSYKSKKNDPLSVTVTLQGSNDFDGPVLLSCSGEPDGTQCSFDNPTISLANGQAATVNLTLTPPDKHRDKTVGTHTLVVTGTSGALSHSVTAEWDIK